MHSSPNSPRGRLLSQFVLARVTDLKGINIGLFDFDRHNTLYYFVLNSDEEIYLRYGGRDEKSAATYLNEDSFNLALSLALEKHQEPRVKKPKPKALFPREIASLNRDVVATNRCVECHLIADYQAVEMEELGEFFKPRDLFVSPDLKKLGIELDVPKGLVVKGGPGLKNGDLITNLNGVEVLTFADLQYQLNKVERTARKVVFGIKRGGEVLKIEVSLEAEWWVTSLAHRHWSVDPQLYFEAEPLSAKEKESLKLPVDGFASKILYVEIDALLNGSHTLEKNDVIFEVNGVRKDKLTQNVATYLKLAVKAGEGTTLKILRGGKELEMPIETGRLSFRK